MQSIITAHLHSVLVELGSYLKKSENNIQDDLNLKPHDLLPLLYILPFIRVPSSSPYSYYFIGFSQYELICATYSTLDRLALLHLQTLSSVFCLCVSSCSLLVLVLPFC